MTSVELAHRLCKYLKVKDLAMLPAENALEVVDAINEAIQEYYKLVPSAYKRTTIGASLAAPLAITATFTQGSNTFSGYTAVPAQKGCTIVIPSDGNQNQIVGSNQLIRPFNGTTGSQGATIYGDVFQMSQVIERLTADPLVYENKRILYRDETFRNRMWHGNSFGATGWYGQGSVNGNIFSRRVASPRAYWIEPCAQSQGANPPFWVRTDSLPDQFYTLSVEADIAPYKMGIVDLTIPKPLPLDNYTVESCVLLMAAENLITCSLWENDKLFDIVVKRSQVGRMNATNRPHNQGASFNRVGTPAGW